WSDSRSKMRMGGERYTKSRAAARSTGAAALFPFELGKCRNRVPRIVVVKQLPARSLALPGLLRCICQRRSLGDQPADLRGEGLEIALLVRDGSLPVGYHRPMPGDDPRRRVAHELGQIGQKAFDAAVENRDVVDEQEVARKQGGTFRVEHG